MESWPGTRHDSRIANREAYRDQGCDEGRGQLGFARRCVFDGSGAFGLYLCLSGPPRSRYGSPSHVDVRELTFRDKSRADVILQDRTDRLVVAECKQNAPTLNDLNQVDQYRKRLNEEYPELCRARALLVHGGANRVLPEIAKRASELDIELVYFELQVNFSGSRG